MNILDTLKNTFSAIIKSPAINPALAIGSKIGSTIPQTVSNTAQQAGGFFNTIKQTAQTGFTTLANVVNSPRPVAVSDKAVKTGIADVPKKATEYLTGFASNVSNTVGGWLDTTIQKGLDKASDSVFDYLYKTDRPSTNQSQIPSVTGNPQLPAGAGVNTGLSTAGLTGFIPVNSTPGAIPNSSVIPENTNKLLMYGIIALVVFLLLKTVKV